ncbi:hypothetical protein MKZ15_05750 [Paenibacillus sp. FSL R7-0216]|uniref:hypothetical protein n=1 Tax=Paenibacillus sp. FSL R7-0216 TaxID=2921677 RepID=UPI0030DA294E
MEKEIDAKTLYDDLVERCGANNPFVGMFVAAAVCEGLRRKQCTSPDAQNGTVERSTGDATEYRRNTSKQRYGPILSVTGPSGGARALRVLASPSFR